MVNCVYKIIFGKTSFELDEYFDNFNEYEKELLNELDAFSIFDYDDYKNYICYLIACPIDIDKYVSIIINNNIECNYVDISQDILKGLIDLSKELKDKLNGVSIVKYDFFIDDLNEWILDNLDIDTVLDRISEVGLDSLNDREKLFLQKLQPK